MEFHHLSKIAAAYPNKAVSRFATYKIRKLLLEQGLANDDEIVESLLLCRKCSQQLIPGLNCKVFIEKSRKQYRNCAAYLCNICQTKTKFNGIHRDMVKYEKPRNSTREKNKSSLAQIEAAKESTNKIEIPNYASGFRTLNKSEKKKTLLESFFENSESSKLYNIFH